jgi:acid phosphatase (class A)
MKNLFLALFVALAACTNAATHTETATNTPLKSDTVYADQNQYETFKSDLSPVPAHKSDVEKNDYKTLKQWNKNRTAENCARADSEVKISFQGFYGAPHGPLNDEQIAKLSKVYDNVRKDTGYFVWKMKNEFARPRPYTNFPDLNPCIKKEDSFSYPSGHATNAYVLAYVLSDIMPKRQKDFLQRAEVIANDRVVAGVHHPSDIAAGKKLAQEIYDSMKKSELYQKDVKELKSQLQ